MLGCLLNVIIVCNCYVLNFIFLVLHCITVSVWKELRGKDLIIHPRHLEKHCFTAFSHHVSLVYFRFNSLVSSMMAAIRVIVTQVIFLSEWMKGEMPQTQKNWEVFIECSKIKTGCLWGTGLGGQTDEQGDAFHCSLLCGLIFTTKMWAEIRLLNGEENSCEGLVISIEFRHRHKKLIEKTRKS